MEKRNEVTKSEIVSLMAKALKDNYVFPDVADDMAKHIEMKLNQKEYESLDNQKDFCEKLTGDLREVSRDKHIIVRYNEQAKSVDQTRSKVEQQEEYQLKAQLDNYGFRKVERLPGNIGYIDLRGFHQPEYAAETAANAMNFVAHTDALIVDLRKNGGGYPEMVVFLTSYLFESETFHLNSFYLRTNESTRQFWTLPYVPGKKYGEKKPVYVLTSDRTFSAAEEFTYNLKNLNRATIIGDVTAGGANPGETHQLTKHISIFIPNGRAINPITQTNWEGTGIEPDMKTNNPYDAAYKLALEHVMKVRGEESPGSAFVVKEAEKAWTNLK
ncbi:S41 family peptidase [Bacillus sp. THAF10]|uniref:S41 family peptidase n=1 Tax=Bacillus sp. THAF10 TaxID=2587848 RepID=UPI0026573C26|nr:S41 family peptidase [Bacillus sp. THAF10]